MQVSRLGMPLVNEVVIGLKDKNMFNASQPKDDGQFVDYVTNPTLPALLEILFGAAGVKAPNNFPRTDLVAAFLTGIPGVNQFGVPSEMLRLNTAIASDAGGDRRTTSASSAATTPASRTAAAPATTWSTPSCGSPWAFSAMPCRRPSAAPGGRAFRHPALHRRHAPGREPVRSRRSPT